MLAQPSWALFGAAVVASLILYIMFRPLQTVPFPPGPKGTFLVGNALQMPKERHWLTYAEWAKKWGANSLPASLKSDH
jgi:hypothetical protein